MGKFNMYTVYDKVAKRGSTIFLSVNDEIADREFKKFIKGLEDKTENIAKIQDMELINIGTYEMGENNEPTRIINTRCYRVAKIPDGMIPEDYSDDKKETLLERLGMKIGVKR